MMKERIIHCSHADKFIQPFIDYLAENILNFEVKHKFFITGDLGKYSIRIRSNLVSSQDSKLIYYAKLAFSMYMADKIILHGLFNVRLIMLLAIQPWLLNRCYWAIWGGDLYSYKYSKRTLVWWRNEVFRRFAIKRFGHFITHIRGDYELAQKWYGAKGVWHECFLYPSNLYHESPLQVTQHRSINIILGNSADPSNNHIDALEKLQPYGAENIQIFCPLSYGDVEHAKKVANWGKNIFGDKFIPLLEFMRVDEYKKLLAEIDIAIFNHNRQQGMGNIITLLGMGKKVFMRSDVTSYDAMRSLGVVVYDIDHLDLLPLVKNQADNNSKIIANYFSNRRLAQSWREIFRG